MRKIFFFLSFCALIGQVNAQSNVLPAKPQTGTTYITNATIHVGNGKVIENGTIKITNGKIDQVGNDVTVPPALP
jgi:hypothetical protein